MTFLFDYGDEWLFRVGAARRGQKLPAKATPRYPSKGAAPKQYPAWQNEATRYPLALIVAWEIEGNCLVMRPKSARPRYTLAELLAQCDRTRRRDRSDRDWTDSPPVGRELI